MAGPAAKKTKKCPKTTTLYTSQQLMKKPNMTEKFAQIYLTQPITFS